MKRGAYSHGVRRITPRQGECHKVQGRWKSKGSSIIIGYRQLALIKSPIQQNRFTMPIRMWYLAEAYVTAAHSISSWVLRHPTSGRVSNAKRLSGSLGRGHCDRARTIALPQGFWWQKWALSRSSIGHGSSHSSGSSALLLVSCVVSRKVSWEIKKPRNKSCIKWENEELEMWRTL